MKPEMILQADVLDIIFDNRNKEYGAYELRSHYERRLKKSIAVVFVLIAVCVLFYFWMNSISHGGFSKAMAQLSDTVTLTAIDLEKKIIIPEVAHRQVATVQSTVPRIVPDRVVTNPPPTVDDQELKQIGAVNKPGDLVGEIVQPISDGNGKNNAVTEPVEEAGTIIEHPEMMPEFPGGQEALQRFLSRNLKMPRQDLEPGTKIPTMVRFVVDKDGSITGIAFEKSGGKDFDNELMRVMKKMPAWKPGMQNGKNVAVYFKIPVIFQVPDEN